MEKQFSLFYSLQEEMATIENTGSALTRGIDSLEEKVREFEKFIGVELEAIHSQKLQRDRQITEPPKEEQPVNRELPTAGGPQPEPREEAREKPPKPPRRQPIDSELERHNTELELRVGQKVVLALGLVTMIFGVGYFLKYSFEQGWIGPAARVALAFVWGMSFLAGGEYFRKKGYEVFGLWLAGGGSAVLYFASYAGFGIYGLYPQTVAFGVMVMTTVLTYLLAIRYDAVGLAVIGLIGGFLTPFLLSTGEVKHVFLFGYVTVLNIGILLVAFQKRWQILTILGVIFTYAIYIVWILGRYETEYFWSAILFLNEFFLIYSAMPLAYALQTNKKLPVETFGILTPVSFISFGISYWLIDGLYDREWAAIVAVFYALIHTAMVQVLAKREPRSDASIILIGKAALFLILAVPMLFSEYWITVFWGLQGAVLIWMGVRLKKPSVVGAAEAFLLITAFKLVFWDYSVYFHVPDVFMGENEFPDLLAARITTGIMLLAVLIFSRKIIGKLGRDWLGDKDTHVNGIAAAGALIFFVILNFETLKFFDTYVVDAKFAALSVLWGLCSVVMMIKGIKDSVPVLRRVALGLFTVTLIKVFFFDMAKFTTPYRIMSFIGVGLLLVLTSYFYYRFKDKILTGS